MRGRGRGDEAERSPGPGGEMGIRRARRFLFLAAAVLLLHAPPPATSADLYALIYKGCANQSFPGGVAPPSVAALSATLSAQSASAKFYKTSSSSSAAASSTSVFGLFQCRGDLSARVQLAGCLALYEMRRDTTFAALEGGVATSSGGFVATSYQAVYAMAQCQVYLDKCYISYSYYPHGVPHGGGTKGFF